MNKKISWLYLTTLVLAMAIPTSIQVVDAEKIKDMDLNKTKMMMMGEKVKLSKIIGPPITNEILIESAIPLKDFSSKLSAGPDVLSVAKCYIVDHGPPKVMHEVSCDDIVVVHEE